MKQHHSQIVSRARACVGLLAVVLWLLVATERPATAYVDPGTGALVWQGLLATLVGSAFYCRRIIGWVKTKLFKTKGD